MKYLIILIFMIISSSSSFKKFENHNPNCLKLDLILIADKSYSVVSDQDFITNALLSFVDKFELSEDGIKIGLIGFSSEAYLYNKLTSNKNEIKNSINYMQSIPAMGSTNMHSALLIGANELMGNGRNDTFKIIVLITDGQPDSEYQTEIVAQQIKEFNKYNICGVFVKNDLTDHFLKRISSENCYVETYFENLIVELNKLDVCL